MTALTCCLVSSCGGDSPRQKATAKLIGVWTGRIDAQYAQELAREFPIQSPAALQSIEITYKFRYEERLEMVNRVGPQTSETPGRWRVASVDGDEVIIEITPDVLGADEATANQIRVVFDGENRFRRLDPSGKGRTATFERVK